MQKMNPSVKRSISRVFSSLGMNHLWANYEEKSLSQMSPNIILMYHGISKDIEYNSVTIRQFSEQLRFLKDHYPVISMKDFSKSLNTPSNEASVTITIDDAYENFFENGLPLLEKYAVPATVFVPAGLMGELNNSKDPAYAGTQRIIDAEKLCGIESTLLEYGSHSWSHIPLKNLSDSEIQREIFESKKVLSEKLGKNIDYFAFPFGRPWHQDIASIRAVEKAGYKLACSSRWGRYNSQKTRWQLHRLCIRPSDTLEDFKQKIEGWYDWVCIMEKFR